MFPVLYVDGQQSDVIDEETERIEVACNPDGPTELTCRNCGELLADDAQSESCSNSGDGAHAAVPMPLSWCNAAAISLDPASDEVSVSISVGDPRGAFVFTVRRVPDDADGQYAGRLLLHTPYPGEPCPHMRLTAIHPGTYVIGDASVPGAPELETVTAGGRNV